MAELQAAHYSTLQHCMNDIVETVFDEVKEKHEDDVDNGHHGTASEQHDHNDGDIDHTFSCELRHLNDSSNKADKLAKEIIEQQTTLEPLTSIIQEKSIVGKTFTNILICV